MIGLRDTEDKLWMGNESGPLLYEDEALAKVAALMCDQALHQRLGRTRAQEFEAGPVRLHDEKPLLETAEAALARLEEGR